MSHSSFFVEIPPNFAFPDAQNHDSFYLQWRVDHISDVKKKLSSAITLKKEYSETIWLRQITKFFLILFGFWGGGVTSCIKRAEAALIDWNSDSTSHRGFPPEDVDLDNFFNYRSS